MGMLLLNWSTFWLYAGHGPEFFSLPLVAKQNTTKPKQQISYLLVLVQGENWALQTPTVSINNKSNQITNKMVT